MTLAVYTGHETLTFQDYMDMGTGRTLTAEPGRSYDVAPASGHPVPDIPTRWFAPVLTDEQKNQARDLYQSGREVPEVAAETGLSEGAVHRTLSELGVELRPAPEPPPVEIAEPEHHEDEPQQF